MYQGRGEICCQPSPVLVAELIDHTHTTDESCDVQACEDHTEAYILALMYDEIYQRVAEVDRTMLHKVVKK